MDARDEHGRPEGDDPRALLECVYGELRRLAHRQMAREAAPATLQTTALVHEAWLRLAREGRTTWESRAQFFVAAANAMRRILVERARSRSRVKRGGEHRRVAWDDERLAAAVAGGAGDGDGAALLALDGALDALRELDARLAQVVELRVFAGLTEVETGEVLGRSPRSVRRDWRAARLWLWRRLQASEDGARAG